MKKCGSPCKTGKPCKKTSPCSIHGKSSSLSPKKSPKKSSSSKTPKNLLFKRLEKMPTEIIWQTLLRVAPEDINSVCRAFPGGNISAVCSDERFQKEYKENPERIIPFHVNIANKVAMKYGRTDQDYFSWVLDKKEKYACSVAIDYIVSGNYKIAAAFLLKFAIKALQEEYVRFHFEDCMNILLESNVRTRRSKFKKWHEDFSIFYNNYHKLLKNKRTLTTDQMYDRLIQKTTIFEYVM